MRRLGFLLVLPLLCVLLALSCNPREWFFRPNPNLTLLMSDNESGAGASLFAATWSPDEQQLFYLRTSTQTLEYLSSGGMLWSATAVGAETRQLLPDTFCALDVTLDGSKLVLASGRARRAGGKLVVLRLDSLEADTIDTGRDDIFDVSASRTDPERVYYASDRDGIRSIRLDGTGDRPELPDVSDYFDLTPTDSIVYMPRTDGDPKPAVHPTGGCVAYVDMWTWPASNVWLLDLQTDESRPLDARPYYLVGLSHPRWSRDGSRLLFTAQPLEGGYIGPCGGGELWVLENIPGD